MNCPLCRSNNIVLEQVYDEQLQGSRCKGRCVDCELIVISDTFPTYPMAMKHLLQIWREIKPIKKGRKKDGKK